MTSLEKARMEFNHYMDIAIEKDYKITKIIEMRTRIGKENGLDLQMWYDNSFDIFFKLSLD